MEYEKYNSEPKLVNYSPLKSLSIVSGQLMRHRKENRRNLNANVSIDIQNGKTLPNTHGISLIQAARDGLLDVVKSHLELSRTAINDVDEEGFTALHYAARYNQTDVVAVLLAAGADMNVKQDQDEVRPLHLAARYNSKQATVFLLANKCSINVKDVKGRTPLHYATRKGHGEIIKVLISVNMCNVNEPDNDQTTPLIMAALQGNADICETLIFRGADVERRDINEMTALMWASAEGHTNVSKVLLKSAQRHGPEKETNYIKACDKEGQTALHMAVQNGSLEVVNLLLAHGANVNSERNNMWTALHLAATFGFLDIAKVLVYNGAFIDSRDVEQLTPCHKAALYNKVEILEFLVKRGANLNAKDKKNMSPLHCACWKGQTEAVEFLLSNGAQIAEVDVELKTALHWAVRFEHFDTLSTLLKYGGQNLVSYTDKNDQTVLHYAAYTGNLQILKILLDVGASPNAKDQEERSPLHIAAQNDNVACIEALIQASNHETNDDDLDGRTPLLLACMSGHHQVVQMLLSLGSDVSRRDDEHCTALMLAAASGHSVVMKILLENHASVNDLDKMKNTALHYACQEGHVEAVQLLLDKKVDVTLKNTYGHAPLDLAVDNGFFDVVNTMLRKKSICQSCLGVRDKSGKTVFDRLIERLPEAAMIVLDHCVEKTSRDDKERNLMMTFDYQYVDPGPEDASSEYNRYFAMNTMVKYERDTLLSHELCQNLLSQKWVRFGRFIFFLNLFTYLGYLCCLTFYVYQKTGENNVSVCPNRTNETTIFTEPEKEEIGLKVLRYFLYIFLCIFFFRDLTKIISQKWKYLFSFYNIIVWILMITTLMFVIDQIDCVTRWRAGWIAMFVAWINFIMYLRRIDLLGIYVIMFVTILSSLLKVVLVFAMFCGAFAGSFYIVMEGSNGFNNVGRLLINVVVMTLGEIEYIDGFLDLTKQKGVFEDDSHYLLLIFLFLMPIVLMNLMIGVAVGDIEKIQKNAYLKRIGLQVDLMYNIENNMPRFAQKAVHVKRATVRPNEVPTSMWQTILQWFFGSSRKVEFIEAGRKDHMVTTLESLTEKLKTQQFSLKTVQLALQQQNHVLTQLANKFDVQVPPFVGLTSAVPHSSDVVIAAINPPVVVPPSDSLSIYDGVQVGIDRRRQRSVRAPVGHKEERPRSTIL